MAAGSVSIAGPVGFVGLIAPHLSRFFFRNNQIEFILGASLFGSLLVLIADGVGRFAFAPIQIPAGILTAIIGVPFLLFLLKK